MQTKLPPAVLSAPGGRAAEAVLRRCVHCGFCNSACPTYLHFGDERNGPRGRIYFMKRFLEGDKAEESNLRNLDLCLTCQACESACPSGVEYLRLLEWTRPQVAAAVGRPPLARARRALAIAVLLRPRLLRALAQTAAVFRPLLPKALKPYAARRAKKAAAGAASAAKKRVVLYDGCAQSAFAPNINAHAKRVLAAAGMEAKEARGFCCGALQLHLEDTDAAMRRIRANVDALWQRLQDGAQAVASSASGCGRTIASYGELLANDPNYAHKAQAVSAAHCDISALLAEADLSGLSAQGRRVAFHCPCTLQHAQKGGATPPALLRQLGAEVTEAPDGGMCCGAAGFYAAENPKVAKALRKSRLQQLGATGQKGAPADGIVTANIGCQLHLQGGTKTPVRHWLEVVEAPDSARD